MPTMGASMKKVKKVKIERLFGRQYLSDKPCWDDPKSFRGKVTLVKAGTGSGKSTAMLNLAEDDDYLGKNDKMLFMTTRRTDAAKLRAKVEKLSLTAKVDVMTVQSFEEAISVYDMSGAKYLEQYKIVVCDESHYWLTDTAFSTSSILSYEAVRSFADAISDTDKMLFLMSATPERLNKIFPVSRNVSGDVYTDHIRQVVFVPDEDYVAQAALNISRAIQNGKKGIVFVRNKNDIYKILTELGAQAERVEVYTAEKRPECLDSGEYEIPEGKNAIIATSVLAYGVDYNDWSIEFVMTNSADPVVVVQELGRRRCFGEKEADYYVSDFTSDYLLRAYQTFRKYLTEAETFSENPDEFFKAGGHWYEGFIHKNRAFRVKRHTTTLTTDAVYMETLRRFADYAVEIEDGTDSWEHMVLSRLGFDSRTPAPVKPYKDIVAEDVKSMLSQMEAAGVLTTDDWKMLGKMLRAKNRTIKGKGTSYKHGDYLSSPKKIDPLIRPYGYSAGERQQKQKDGKRISYYPLIRLNDAERDGE